jgi:deazaflavin-dependent oxidoreductase (nitroreductase family)
VPDHHDISKHPLTAKRSITTMTVPAINPAVRSKRDHANALQRIVQHVASWRPVAAVFRHTFHHVDRRLFRVLGGRGLSSVLGGVPEILLTTTGARSGQRRTVPLVGIDLPDGRVAVIGTRWGSQHEPGWSHNLTANPHADVERHGRHHTVVARRVPPGPEYDAIMDAADSIYIGFASYRPRITRRDIPIYVLDAD